MSFLERVFGSFHRKSTGKATQTTTAVSARARPGGGFPEPLRIASCRTAHGPASSGRQCASICMPATVRPRVRFVFVIALRAVIGLCPVTVENRLVGPLMEGLPQKFRTAPAPMHPVLLAAGFGHRGDPRVLLDLGGVRI